MVFYLVPSFSITPLRDRQFMTILGAETADHPGFSDIVNHYSSIVTGARVEEQPFVDLLFTEAGCVPGRDYALDTGGVFRYGGEVVCAVGMEACPPANATVFWWKFGDFPDLCAYVGLYEAFECSV